MSYFAESKMNREPQDESNLEWCPGGCGQLVQNCECYLTYGLPKIEIPKVDKTTVNTYKKEEK